MNWRFLINVIPLIGLTLISGCGQIKPLPVTPQSTSTPTSPSTTVATNEIRACLQKQSDINPVQIVLGTIWFKAPLAARNLKLITNLKDLEVITIQYKYPGFDQGSDGLKKGESWESFLDRLNEETKETTKLLNESCKTEKCASNTSTPDKIQPFIQSMTVRGKDKAFEKALDVPDVAFLATESCQNIPSNDIKDFKIDLLSPEEAWQNFINGWKEKNLTLLLSACGPDSTRQQRCREQFTQIQAAGGVQAVADKLERGRLVLQQDADDVRFYEIITDGESQAVVFGFFPDIGWKITEF